MQSFILLVILVGPLPDQHPPLQKKDDLVLIINSFRKKMFTWNSSLTDTGLACCAFVCNYSYWRKFALPFAFYFLLCINIMSYAYVELLF